MALLQHHTPSWHSVLCVSIWILALAATLPQYYVLDAGNLLIRQGWRRIVIPYSSLVAAQSVHESWSAAVYSADRVLLTTSDNREYLIAPRDRPRFLSELSSRSPHLQVT